MNIMTYICGLFKHLKVNGFLIDDEHSDREPERHGHVCVFLHAVDGGCHGGRHSYVTRQHLWSVRLSHLAGKTTDLVFSRCINLRHSAHGNRSLRCRCVSYLVQKQRKNSTCLSVINVVSDEEILARMSVGLLVWLLIIGVDPVRVRGSGLHNKLVVRVLYGLDPHNNVTTEWKH